MQNDQFLWVEKYRPKTISECLLPEDMKKTFQGFIEQDDLPNLLLAGGAGSGKTTVARALCNEMNVDYLMINGSLEGRNIDTLRNEIQSFASTVSLSGGKKVVILDEADYLNPQTFQPALRGFIEEFSKNCRFILTCNYKHKIIDPLHSRTTVIDFKYDKKTLPKLMSGFMTRLIEILKLENVSISNKAILAELIKKHFPDYRRILNELQRYSANGIIDEGVLVAMTEVSLNDLVKALKNKDFSSMRKWVADNSDMDPQTVFRMIYDHMYEFLKPGAIPPIVLLLADYQYKSAFVADPEINLVAFLTEVMVEGEFK